MAKQNKTKDIEKDQETVNQYDDSQNMRADLDGGGDVPAWEAKQEPQRQQTGRFQEDRNRR